MNRRSFFHRTFSAIVATRLASDLTAATLDVGIPYSMPKLRYCVARTRLVEPRFFGELDSLPGHLPNLELFYFETEEEARAFSVTRKPL